MKKEKVFFIAAIGFVLSVNIYFRAFPITFPQLKTQASSIVKQIVQQQATAEVQKRFPQFYYSAKDAIVQSEIKQYYKYNKANIRKQIGDIYKNLKNRYQDDGGQTYLMELDCWHWARYVENVLKFGHPGDAVIDGKQWDMLMIAPKGAFLSWGQLLFYFSAFLYKVFSLFTAVPLFTFLFYLPLFFTCLFIIALFLFSFKYGGYIGATVSCLFVGLAPVFLPRSCAGWFDMDIFNLLFPVLIVWAYLISVEKVMLRRKVQWLVISAFFVGLFAFTSWAFWWYIVVVILGCELFFWGCSFIEYCYFRARLRGSSGGDDGPLERAETSAMKLSCAHRNALAAVLFVAFSFSWVFLIAGVEPFTVLYNDIKRAVVLNKPLMASIWPNVFSTVGELRKMNLREIGNTIAPAWIVGLSLLCMAVTALRAFLSKSFSNTKRSAIVIFIIWYLLMFFATMRGVRFAVFLLVPFAVCLGWGIHDTMAYFRNRKSGLGVGIVMGGALVLCVSLANKGYAVAKSIYPLMDDTWYQVLNLAQEKTPQETIINSWWDFGDWFKVVAGRRVIFDGQSQHLPQAYWMAKALLSQDENQAVAILRMLNNAGNKAFELLDQHMKDPLQSALLLEHVLTLPQEKAGEVLKKILSQKAADEAIKILFSPAAKAVFVVDHTMPFKMPAISYLGNWSFPKVYIAQNFSRIEKNQIVEYLKNLSKNEIQIEQFYQEAFLIENKDLDEWLSQRVQFYSALTNGRLKDDSAYFENGFVYNVKDGSVHSNNGQIPRSAFVFRQDDLVEVPYSNPNVPFSILIYEVKGEYKSILLDTQLGRSLFVRLYFLGGRGLKHFTPLIDAEEGNNYIRFFNILW